MAAEVDFEGFSEGSLESLGGGRWRSRFSRTTAHGREQVSRTFQAKGKRAAKRRAEEIRRGLDERERRRELPLKVTDEDMLLPNFQERYIGALEAGDGIAPTTAANYRHCAQHVCRYLGKARVDEITGDMVLRMQSMLLADELCPNTVARAHRFLKQALRYAVDEGIIARSPFTRHVKAPRRTQPEPNSLDRDGRERLPSWLDSVGDTEVTLAIRLGLACGLRREEMCGLRWRDVDLDLHLLRVAVSQCEGKAFVKGPKTPRSRRDVPLEPDLEARLARRRKRVARECSPEARGRPLRAGKRARGLLLPRPALQGVRPHIQDARPQGDRRQEDRPARPEAHLRHLPRGGRDRHQDRVVAHGTRQRGDDTQHLRERRPGRQGFGPGDHRQADGSEAEA